MVPHDAVLDKAMLRKIIASGHSRIPVHRPGKPCAPSQTQQARALCEAVQSKGQTASGRTLLERL